MENNLQNIYSANIGITTVTEHDGMYGYSSGASGVIFLKIENRYYVLTAYHVEKENDSYLIATVNTGTFTEYKESHSIESITTARQEYYKTMPEAIIEYTCEESDLAIISFESDEDLEVISIANELPEKGDKIMVVANLNGEFFHTTYGKITSSKLTKFSADDDQSVNSVLHNSAYVTSGSSGGAVINDEMELVGINIGGGTDFLGRFKYGVLIPSDQIKAVISDWKDTIGN